MTGDIIIQPVGGFVGAAGPTNRFRSEGRMPLSALSKEDRARVLALFSHPSPPAANFYYHIIIQSPEGTRTVDAPPEAVPEALRASIRSVLE